MHVLKFKKDSDILNDTFKTIFKTPLFNDLQNFGSANAYTPKVRISENKDSFQINLELPGLSKEDVKLSVENNVLTIAGNKKEDAKTEDTNLIVNEIYYGEFSRNFNLSKDINLEAIDAEFNNGVLKITLPKIEEAKPAVKEISIK